MDIVYNTATEKEIFQYLTKMNTLYVPALNTITNIEAYSRKLYDKAFRIEYYQKKILSGFLACYFNEEQNFVFVTTISVLPEYQNLGIAQQLLNKIIELSKANPAIKKIDLEVSNQNTNAQKFYIKNGFEDIQVKQTTKILSKDIT
ncbi:GNAT family N-acetyltransferase [Empedobacter falsenii]|uniref:GNAT family N-acetyltransferase n=1 Tax=Empedobacter falsenii TaxID=343874 RepID=A0ABY8VA71_9FLAO|nr:N-acetyltransferase [Empedobacter falsenii]WIH98581.1 GNAT family N-acetyltransferase [Empedobacter falsenii]